MQADRAFKASEQVVIGTQDIARVSDETAAASLQMSENIDSLDSMLMTIKNLLQQYNTSIVPVKQTPMKKVKIGIYCILDNDFWHEVRRGIIYAKNVLEAIGAEVRYIPFENWDLVANLPNEFRKMQDEGLERVDHLLRGGGSWAKDPMGERAHVHHRSYRYGSTCSDG